MIRIAYSTIDLPRSPGDCSRMSFKNQLATFIVDGSFNLAKDLTVSNQAVSENMLHIPWIRMGFKSRQRLHILSELDRSFDLL
jgi:hypothetical protein